MKVMWAITITSEHILFNKTKDFIAELIDNENHKVVKEYGFILYDILEDKRSCMAIIEGSELSAKNLTLMLKDNITYLVSYRRIDS